MSSTVTVKQGTPSAPGEQVDTSAAKVVPASSEVGTETAARETAKGKKATQAKVEKLAKGMTGGKKPAAKAKATTRKATKGNTGNAFPRLTHEWTGKDKKDVQIGDHVKLPDGTVINVIGRWTRHKKDSTLTPMVTGRVLTGENKGTKKGERKSAVAAEVTHVTKK
jgi:hypothetical protein